MTEKCPYCEEVYYEDGDTPSKEYMWEGHVVLECNHAPKEEIEWFQ